MPIDVNIRIAGDDAGHTTLRAAAKQDGQVTEDEVFAAGLLKEALKTLIEVIQANTENSQLVVMEGESAEAQFKREKDAKGE